MRTDLLACLATASLVAGHAIERRADQAAEAKKWHPITTDPSFFQLKVNVNCDDYDDTPTVDGAAPGAGGAAPAAGGAAPAAGGAAPAAGGAAPAAGGAAPAAGGAAPAAGGAAPAAGGVKRQTTQNAAPSNCGLQGYGIRLENYQVIATPYDRWYDPTVATFFVDDDTAMYTVSKDPLQMYINAQTGQFQYAKVGWLPSNAIGLHFFHTGDSPLGTVGEGQASSFLTWPSTQGIVPENGSWMFCPRGTEDARTGTYELFIDDLNFPSSGVDKATCLYANLVAADANPWRQKQPHHHHHHHDDYNYDNDDDDADADDSDNSYPSTDDDK